MKIFKFSGILILLVFLTAFIPETDKRIVVIDAGHGGKDQGLTTGSILEKDIVLQIAKKVQDLNENEDLEIILTREEDRFMELDERVKTINYVKPDLMLSLHVNQHTNESHHGSEIYTAISGKFNKASEEVAKKFQNLFSAKDQKFKKADLVVLKNSECPAVLLELGYVPNKKDLDYLSGEKGQTEIAEAILKSVQ